MKSYKKMVKLYSFSIMYVNFSTSFSRPISYGKIENICMIYDLFFGVCVHNCWTNFYLAVTENMWENQSWKAIFSYVFWIDFSFSLLFLQLDWFLAVYYDKWFSLYGRFDYIFITFTWFEHHLWMGWYVTGFLVM